MDAIRHLHIDIACLLHLTAYVACGSALHVEIDIHHFLVIFFLRLFLVSSVVWSYIDLLVQNATDGSICAIHPGLTLNFLLLLLRLGLS